MTTSTTVAHLTEAAALRHTTLRLSRRLRKQSGAGLTPSQMSALATLERHGTIRIGELARLEQIGKSSTTRLAARLEEAGYIRREADPEDGRGYSVALTELGRDLLDASNERANAYLARQLAALDAADRRHVVAALPALERLLGVKA